MGGEYLSRGKAAAVQPTPVGCARPVPAVGMDPSRVNEMLRSDTHRRRNDDPALLPIEEALNDVSLNEVERNALVGEYMSEQRSEVPWSLPMDYLNADFPLSSGDGLASHLLGELKTDEKLRAVAASMGKEATRKESDGVDIQAVWANARFASLGQEADGAEMGPESDLRALRAMALMSNARKIGKPKDLDLEGETLDAYEAIHGAHDAARKSNSPDASVMSRGASARARTKVDGEKKVNPVNAMDHNFHFFSHAYLAAQLSSELDYTDEQATATSGYIGARYEWDGAGIAEREGNAALKDLLMNAEGAQFGVDLMSDASTSLPGMCEGPVLEDRTSFGKGDPDLYRATWATTEQYTGFGASEGTP